MRIIICSRDFQNGEGQHVRLFIKALDNHDSIEKVLFIGPREIEGLSDKIEQIEFTPLGKYFITRQPHSAIKVRDMIRLILKKGDFDLVHSHFPLLSNGFDTPLVSTFHFLNCSRMASQMGKDPSFLMVNIFHSLFEYFDRKALQSSKKSLFVSKRSMEICLNEYKVPPHKMEFIPNFIDTSNFVSLRENDVLDLRLKYGLSPNRKYVLFVGRLDGSKGFDLLVQSFKALEKVHDDISLLVVGSGPMENIIGESDRIVWLKRIPHEKMVEIYNMADILVLPSLYENAPLTLLEAMSCGLPAIVSNTGDMPDIVDDDSMVLKTFSPPQIKESIDEFMDLPEEDISKIGERNRDIAVNHYGLSNIEKIINVYEKVSQAK